MVVCQDDIRGTFKAEMNLKDKEMKKNVLCSMKTFIESGKVPTTGKSSHDQSFADITKKFFLYLRFIL